MKEGIFVTAKGFTTSQRNISWSCSFNISQRKSVLTPFDNNCTAMILQHTFNMGGQTR